MAAAVKSAAGQAGWIRRVVALPNPSRPRVLGRVQMSNDNPRIGSFPETLRGNSSLAERLQTARWAEDDGSHHGLSCRVRVLQGLKHLRHLRDGFVPV